MSSFILKTLLGIFAVILVIEASPLLDGPAGQAPAPALGLQHPAETLEHAQGARQYGGYYGNYYGYGRPYGGYGGYGGYGYRQNYYGGGYGGYGQRYGGYGGYGNRYY